MFYQNVITGPSDKNVRLLSGDVYMQNFSNHSVQLNPVQQQQPSH